MVEKGLAYVFVAFLLFLSFSPFVHAETKVDSKVYDGIEKALGTKFYDYKAGSLDIKDAEKMKDSTGATVYAVYVEFNTVRDTIFKKVYKEVYFYDVEKGTISGGLGTAEGSAFMKKYDGQIGVSMNQWPMIGIMAITGLFLYYIMYTSATKTSVVQRA